MVKHQGLVKGQNFPRPKRAGEAVVTGTWKELGGSVADAVASPMGAGRVPGE